MPLFHLLLIAVIQGVTEFLPISSSGHLILISKLTDLQDQGPLIDVAVHVGTLGAVILFFWRDVKAAGAGVPQALAGRTDTPGARLAIGLFVATLPVIALGAVLYAADLVEAMRSTAVIGWMMLIFGFVLFWADHTGASDKRAERWTLRDAVIMGLWQALSLIPGTSRSGITITAGRKLGYAREDAARLAMLMSIPTIAASGILLGADAAIAMNGAVVLDAAIAAGFAFLAALLALSLMMRLLRSVDFTPYVIYRVILGLILLVIAYAG